MNIDGLAALIRARLDAEHALAARLAARHVWWDSETIEPELRGKPFWPMGSVRATLNHLKDPDLRAGLDLIEAYNPRRVLAEVRAKRALLDALLAEPHATLSPGGSTEIYCAATDLNFDEPCDCGRDARVHAYLTLLAQPYQETV